MSKRHSIKTLNSDSVLMLNSELKLEIKQSMKEIGNGCYIGQSILNKMVKNWAKVKQFESRISQIVT